VKVVSLYLKLGAIIEEPSCKIQDPKKLKTLINKNEHQVSEAHWAKT
jgi:hypothetical protein